jgi:hypothetical protein
MQSTHMPRKMKNAREQHLFAKVIHDFYHILRLIPLTAPERKMML